MLAHIKKPMAIAIYSQNFSTQYAQTGSSIDSSVVISSDDVEAVAAQYYANLGEDWFDDDIALRHIKVGGKITGVSMVQLTAWDVQDTESGIAHVKIDENGYFVSSEKTRVTGGEFVAEPESNSNLLGPMERGEIKGGV